MAAAGVCRCCAPLDVLVDHALSCNRGVECLRFQDELNARLRDTLGVAGFPAILEPAGLAHHNLRRFDGTIVAVFERGRPLAWDATIIHTCASSHLAASARAATVTAGRLRPPSTPTWSAWILGPSPSIRSAPWSWSAASTSRPASRASAADSSVACLSPSRPATRGELSKPILRRPRAVFTRNVIFCDIYCDFNRLYCDITLLSDCYRHSPFIVCGIIPKRDKLVPDSVCPKNMPVSTEQRSREKDLIYCDLYVFAVFGRIFIQLTKNFKFQITA